MHITDDLDRPVDNYNPILDQDIDIDAPYIDFGLAENTADITPPKNGAYDTLYYKDEPILVVNQVSEIEIRFYTTANPNENYRVGQRHIKGKVLSIDKVKDNTEECAGFILSFDASQEYRGKISNITVDRSYVEVTKARCFCILYFDEEGKITNELVIPIEEWFSANVYLNSSLLVEDPEPYPFKVNDLVDAVVYVKEVIDDEGNFNVIEKEYTGRLAEISLVKRVYTETDENGIDKDVVVYYHLVTIDMSKEYEFYQIVVASTVIKSMKIHKLPPEEP